MRLPLDFDPEQHELHNLPCLKVLRDATGAPNLVTYFNRNYNTWLVALQSYDKSTLLEIDFLCEPDNSSRHPGRQDVARIRRWFEPASSPQEQSAYVRGRERDTNIRHSEEQQSMSDAVDSLARSIHRRFGVGAAARYLQGLGRDTSTLNVRR